jgi:antitoxin component YwqK of YwqJK toxin-antitoxin module
MSRFFKIIVLFLSVQPTLVAHAQECKPIRANRNKTASLRDVGLSSSIWMNEKYRFEQQQRDTPEVSVYSDDKLITRLRTHHSEVVSPQLIVYEKDGQQLIDSLDFRVRRKQRTYFDSRIASSHVYATLNPATRSLTYYRKGGNDSLTIVRYEDGSIWKKTYNNTYNTDSAKLEWSREGILIRKELWPTIYTYYPDGVLKTHRFDTSVNRRVSCELAYYPTGVLQSVEYFSFDKPCHVWRFYTDQGILARSERKTPIDSLPYGIVEAAPPPPQIYSYVEQQPDFRGDRDKYFGEQLAGLLCRSREPLEGPYAVTFMIDADGRTSYQRGEGENIEAIAGELKKMFDNMTGWRPGRINGRPLKAMMEMRFIVQ